MNFLKLVTVGLLLLTAVSVLASTQTVQDKTFVPEDYLPDGQGRDLVLAACVQCHDLRNTVMQRKTATSWRRTVDEMIWRGAPLMVDEAGTVTRYLVESFGPDKPIPEKLKKRLAGDKP